MTDDTRPLEPDEEEPADDEHEEIQTDLPQPKTDEPEE